MRTLFVNFDDEDYDKLNELKVRSGKNWRRYLLDTLLEEDQYERN